MTEQNDFDLTSGDGSILVVIATTGPTPITPEILNRPQKRLPIRDSLDESILPTKPPVSNDNADPTKPE